MHVSIFFYLTLHTLSLPSLLLSSFRLLSYRVSFTAEKKTANGNEIRSNKNKTGKYFPAISYVRPKEKGSFVEVTFLFLLLYSLSSVCMEWHGCLFFFSLSFPPFLLSFYPPGHKSPRTYNSRGEGDPKGGKEEERERGKFVPLFLLQRCFCCFPLPHRRKCAVGSAAKETY